MKKTYDSLLRELTDELRAYLATNRGTLNDATVILLENAIRDLELAINGDNSHDRRIPSLITKVLGDLLQIISVKAIRELIETL